MCDIVPGHLIVSFSRHDLAARELLERVRKDAVDHVSYRESIVNKLARANLAPPKDFDYELHLVEVPLGQENWKMNFLQFYYKHLLVQLGGKMFKRKAAVKAFERSSHHFITTPNHVLSLAAPVDRRPEVSAATYRFGPHFAKYKSAVGLVGPALAIPPDRVRILVVDSGIAADATSRLRSRIVSRHDVLDPSSHAVDQHGHGTAVALVIDDLAPNADLMIMKVADSNGFVTEWDALAGLVADTAADVVNLSLEFGLKPRVACPVCRRRSESSTSRAAVFENVVHNVLERAAHPIVVAAAGNAGKPELSFPARFGGVLAIGSVTSTLALSPSSNYGDIDAGGSPHHNHYVLPGGEPESGGTEDVLVSDGGRWAGTSFAAAFGTAIVSRRLADRGSAVLDRERFLADLRTAAKQDLPGYTIATHGNGLMRA